MDHEETHGIHTEELHQVIRVDDIAAGLGHLHALLRLAGCGEEPGVTEYLLRQRQIQAHQEDGPVECMEADNVFADEMQVAGPVLAEHLV